jgi:hypothetical protein
MNMTTIKDVVVAVASNPSFFDTKQSPDQKIQQVINLLISVDSTINK